MKKINTSPISGMQEFLPATQVTFDNLKSKIQDVYTRHGFLKIETPIIDRAEILFAKAGGDTEKQVYKVIKTTETEDDSDQALRFDHTVPLARYVVEHESDLSFPFKATQIGRNFRGERAQKGRFRELYQCDADIIGRGTLSVNYDYDIVSTLIDTYEEFELGTPVIARISNRKILTGLLEALNLQELSKDIYDIIDHSEKVPQEKTEESLKEIGLSDSDMAKIMAFMELHGNRSFVVKNLHNIEIDNEKFEEGVNELDQVLYLLETQGYENNVEADMRIVRGLDYYTGIVFEFMLPEYKKIGSVGGGGRYENLAGNFTDQSFPGVGGSIGLSRLFYVLNENKLLRSQVTKPIDYMIIPISENEYELAFKVAKNIREEGKIVDIVLTDKRLGDKMTYAAKLAKFGIVIGEDEVKTGELKVKDFETGETEDFNILSI